MMEQLPLPGLTPIEMAVAVAVERELRAELGHRGPASTHPAAIAAQDRRRIAAQARHTAEANEATRRRAHRLALEASMEANRIARAAEQGDD